MSQATEKPRVLFLHTLNGHPARYIPGIQICYRGARAIKLAESLSQIKREQTASKRWRRKQGYSDGMEYGHARVITP